MTASRHDSGNRESGPSSRSRVVVGTPSATTRTVLRSLSWWQASAAPPVRRRVFPEPVLPVIIDLAGPGWFLESPAGDRGPQVSNLGVGLHQRFGVLNAPASPSCVLLELDPLGAYRLFGIPLHELSEQTFDVADIVGAKARELRPGAGSQAVGAASQGVGAACQAVGAGFQGPSGHPRARRGPGSRRWPARRTHPPNLPALLSLPVPPPAVDQAHASKSAIVTP